MHLNNEIPRLTPEREAQIRHLIGLSLKKEHFGISLQGMVNDSQINEAFCDLLAEIRRLRFVEHWHDLTEMAAETLLAENKALQARLTVDHYHQEPLSGLSTKMADAEDARTKKPLTKEVLAARITGREMGNEITEAEIAEARQVGLVVVFGYSDDNVEFRGAINDELGAWQGRKFILSSVSNAVKSNAAIVYSEDVFRDSRFNNSYLVQIEVNLECGNVVQAVWGPDDLDASWYIKTELPHAHFDVFNQGGLFCRGLVLSLGDLRS